MLARIHDEMLQSMSHLDDTTKGKVLLAYVNYQLYDVEPSQDDLLVYSIFKAKQFDLDSIKNDFKVASENWKKWWAPQGNQNACKNWENISKQPKTTQNNPKTNEQEKEKEKEKEKENINNNQLDEFEDALSEFVKMRKQIKKPITQKWIELIKEKLNKMYPNKKDLWIKCLYKSIENSWQWVFELKQEDIDWYKPPQQKKFMPQDPNKILSLNELIWKSEN